MNNLAYIDWAILAAYAVTIVVIGVVSGRKEKNTEDYFLGGRSMPWWAVMVSIYATSLSALTFIGVPGAAYAGDFYYLQLGVGDLCGKLVICFLLLTAYYRSQVTTVYELLGERFGPRTRDAGTGFFLVGRILASGVRLAGCAIAIHVVFEVPVHTAIWAIAAVAVVYTFAGGIKAVIWTDMIQFFLFMAAAAIALTTIISSLPEGFSQFWNIASAEGKFKVFHDTLDSASPNYWLDLSNPKAFLAGFLFGCFTGIAALGTDQDLVQRMLTCKNVKESQRALILTGILNFPITLLFLSVGTAVFVYYQITPDTQVAAYEAAKQTDYIFPHFIKTVLAPGMRGILIAGLFAAAMSSLDSALNALASTAYVDIYKRYINPHDKDDANSVAISRIYVALFALILASVASLFSQVDSILWFGFRIFGYLYGALLAVFLLAVMSKRRFWDTGNLIAMLTSVVVVIWLTSKNIPGTSIELWSSKPLAWQWALPAGTIWTVVVALLFSKKESEQNE
ncbi:sodium:solute symporter [Candidatus Uabimicrobium amorphum]|uniref:Sodium:solute symporter n=1 Tax=Uabimicrobium amorphum TaxID=2596890 RepID=A0A5S9IT86_UABAM|nr:sodium:solute symporter [Candidatus Uabimicrobium amorphum]BBM86720.1 sodium:solute symporter [Candidatus Uabimicrobium amorphum]